MMVNGPCRYRESGRYVKINNDNINENDETNEKYYIIRYPHTPRTAIAKSFVTVSFVSTDFLSLSLSLSPSLSRTPL